MIGFVVLSHIDPYKIVLPSVLPSVGNFKSNNYLILAAWAHV